MHLPNTSQKASTAIAVAACVATSASRMVNMKRKRASLGPILMEGAMCALRTYALAKLASSPIMKQVYNHIDVDLNKRSKENH